MKKFLIPFQYYDPFMRLGLNQRLMQKVENEQNVYFSLTGWDTVCISIGVHQKITNVLTPFARENMPLIRRESGGGAVILTRDDICWGIVAPQSYFPQKKQDIYRFACERIQKALHEMHIPSDFKEPNDIITENGKISGSAIVEKNGVIYVMGTLLFKKDKELMNRCLCPEFDRKPSVKEQEKRITSISDESSCSFVDAVQIVQKHLCDTQDIQQYEWTLADIAYAQEIAQKMSDKKWIYAL
ncbi:MAG: biotin/lipoate A/B protein ligase family protein [Candidatus Woesearchaeota archaeon]